MIRDMLGQLNDSDGDKGGGDVANSSAVQRIQTVCLDCLEECEFGIIQDGGEAERLKNILESVKA